MKKVACLLIILGIPILVGGTHLRCGYITVKRVNPTNLTCRITLYVYSNTGSAVAFGTGVLDFGNGAHVVVPVTPGDVRSDLGSGVALASYSVLHTYAGPGSYAVNYSEIGRIGGITNMSGSISSTFYLETSFTIDPFLGPFDSPEFSVDPFFQAKLGSNLSLSAGAISTDDHIITYELAPSIYGSNYQLPENFKINPVNGLITWDTKFLNQYIAGNYLFAIKIHMWKNVDNQLYRLCTVFRDFQITLIDSGDTGRIWDNRELDENNRLYIPENETQTIKIFYEPNPESNTSLMVYSGIEEEGVLSFTTYDSASANIKVGVLTLSSVPSAIRNSPYLITIRGKHRTENTMFASDLVYMFYTRDNFPPLITHLEDDINSVEVYPNPFTDFITINKGDAALLRVMLVDPFGHVLLVRQLDKSVTLDLRNISSGIYLCEVRTNTGRKTFKLVKN